MEPVAHQECPRRSWRAYWRLLVVGSTFLPLLLVLSLLGSAGAVESLEPGLSILASDESGMLLEWISPPYVVREVDAAGDPYLELEVSGLSGQVTAAGHPQLPLWSGLIAVPPGRDVRVRVLEVEAVTASLPGVILPAPSLSPDGGAMERRFPDADLYRRDALYPATLALSEPIWYLRDQRVARLVFYPLRVNPARNRLEHAQRLLVRVDFVAQGIASAGAPVSSSPAIQSLLKSVLLNYDEAQAWRGLPADFRAPEPGLEVGAPAYKIEVDADGVYRVSYADLLAAGMDVTRTNPLSFALTSQGQPVAIEWFGGEQDTLFEPGEGFDFYGQEFRGTVMEEKYTDVNVYWLTDQGAPGPRMAPVDGTLAGAPPANSYRATVHLEEDLKWNTLHTVNLGPQDTWFWRRVRDVSQVTLPITLTAKAPGEYTATVRLKQFSDCRDSTVAGEHRVQLQFNGLLLDDQTWSGVGTTHCSIHMLSGLISQTALLEDGDDQVTWSVLGTTNVGEWLNWIEVAYQRRFVALQDELTFGGDVAGTWTYTLTGFTSDTVTLWDITYPLTPTRVLSPAVSGSGPYTVAFQSQHLAGTTFIAVSDGSIRAPLSVTRYVPPDLDPPGGADWVAITHPDFLTEVQRLADYRASTGLQTMVVDVNHLYNQYSDGIYQPSAIRDYLAHALGWSGVAPGYALLVGDGNSNFRDVYDCYYYSYPICYPEPIYIPPYLAIVDPWQGEVPADNLYATLVGDDAVPDIALGRLPVRTLTETALLVDKIIQHESQLLDPPQWRRDVVLVADESTPVDDFHAQSDVTAALLPDAFNPVKIYHMLPPYTSTEATYEAVAGAFGRGATLVNYRGHGSIQNWGAQLFTVGDVPALTNTARLPAVLTMDCLDTYFAWPGAWQALSEELLRHSGGSVGHWGSSGLGYPAHHSLLNSGFFDALFHDGLNRFGDAAVAAKIDLAAVAGGQDHNLHTFTLLGDPAMPLLLPDLQLEKRVTSPLWLEFSQPAAPAGKPLTYTLWITNQGLGSALGLLLDTVPLNAAFAAATGSYQNTEGVVTWSLPALSSGEGVAVQLGVIPAVDYMGTVTNEQYFVTGDLVGQVWGSPVSVLIIPPSTYLPIALRGG